jgi:hypothetical protein
MGFDHGVVCAAFEAKKHGGRGGIRTHGGFLAHARFRVECLKPDSATLPCGHVRERLLDRSGHAHIKYRGIFVNHGRVSSKKSTENGAVKGRAALFRAVGSLP